MLVEARWNEDGVSGVDVIGVRGPLDVPTGTRVSQRILDLAKEGGRDFVVDLSAAEIVHPDAMAPILRTCIQLESDGGRVSAVFDRQLTIFTIAGLEAFFNVEVTTEDAAARLMRARTVAEPAASTAASE